MADPEHARLACGLAGPVRQALQQHHTSLHNTQAPACRTSWNQLAVKTKRQHAAVESKRSNWWSNCDARPLLTWSCGGGMGGGAGAWSPVGLPGSALRRAHRPAPAPPARAVTAPPLCCPSRLRAASAAATARAFHRRAGIHVTSCGPCLSPSLRSSVPPFLRPSVPPSLRPSVPPSLRPSVPPFLRSSVPPSLSPPVPQYEPFTSPSTCTIKFLRPFTREFEVLPCCNVKHTTRTVTAELRTRKQLG
jgi:hypothetical protein